MGLALVWQSTVPIVKPEQHPATADEGKSTKHRTELLTEHNEHKKQDTNTEIYAFSLLSELRKKQSVVNRRSFHHHNILVDWVPPWTAGQHY